MSEEFDRTQFDRDPRRTIRRKPAEFQEAPGEAEAVRDAFLKGAGPSLARQAAALSGADGATQARVVSRLQQERGNAYVQRIAAAHNRGIADQRHLHVDESDEVRQRAEGVTGYDLSEAQIKPDSLLAAAGDVEALTVGQEIHLAPGQYQPQTPHGAHVLAHELAHVAQQGSGETADIAVPGRAKQLEMQAEAVAYRTAEATPHTQGVRALAVPSRPIGQAFDPRYHRQSVVEGMVGTGFSAEEIGAIYAANWERDFSQAHPALAAIVLAWKNVKLAAAEGRLTEPEINNFEGTVSNLVNMIPFRVGELMSGETYGGYRFFEHMDNPTGDPNMSSQTREALLRVPPGATIPQYMLDSREYIKAQLFRATQAYRGDMSEQSTSAQTAAAFRRRAEELARLVPGGRVIPGGTPASVVAAETAGQARRTPVQEINFPEGETITAQRPDGSTPAAGGLPTSGPAFNAEVDRRFWQQTHYKVGQRLDPRLPEDQPYIRIWLRVRDQVRAERQAQAVPSGAQVIQMPPETIVGRRPQVIQMPPETITGRVRRGPTGHWGPEVADGLGRASHALEDFFAHSNFVEIAIGEVAPTAQITTGTFGEADKKHSLAHKIRAVADEIDAEMPLVNRVTGRTRENPPPEQVNIGSTAPPAQAHEEPTSWWSALGRTGLEAGATILGRTLGGATLGATAGRVLGGALGSPLGPLGMVIGAGLGATAGAIWGGITGLRSGIMSAARNVIATPRGVQMLRRVAELLEEQTRSEAQPGSHTALAKDQPGHENTAFGRLRTIKFQLAQQLAAAADRQVLGVMRQVLDAPSPESADVLLQDIYKTLDAMIQPPTPGHPLAPLIDSRRAEAVKALQEYQQSQRR